MKEKFTRKNEKLPRNEKQPLKNVQNPPAATATARAATTAETGATARAPTAETATATQQHNTEKKDDNSTEQRHNRDNGEGRGGEERRGEERREEKREEVKLCEGREGGEMMKMMYPKTQKNAVASGKSGFLHVEISKYTTFSSKKNGANCETPLPVFLNILSKKRPFRV